MFNIDISLIESDIPQNVNTLLSALRPRIVSVLKSVAQAKKRNRDTLTGLFLGSTADSAMIKMLALSHAEASQMLLLSFTEQFKVRTSIRFSQSTTNLTVIPSLGFFFFSKTKQIVLFIIIHIS